MQRTILLVLGLGLLGWSAQAAESAVVERLRSALLLRASFDRGLDADFAAGDPRLYTAPTGQREPARPGLPDGDLVRRDPVGGRHGAALQFT
jgi:hypothetical protein